MAYDFGSQTLGIANPFKKEGVFRAVGGGLVLALAIYAVAGVPDLFAENKVRGYTLLGVAFVLIVSGIKHCAVGILQLMRFFVGRTVPTSLAYNHSVSEQDAAQAEKKSLLYSKESLHAMLMGRRNTTFEEPRGWLARLVHSVLPKLTFLPFPLRHLSQEIIAMAVTFLVALLAFAIVYFLVSNGLAGEVAKVLVMPLLSILLLVYLIANWGSTAKGIHNEGNSQLAKASSLSLGVIIGLAIVVPLGAGVFLDELVGRDIDKVQAWANTFPLFSAWANLALLLVCVIAVMALIMPLLYKRMGQVTPKTEVSEFRANMQESVHPNEIFINIENIVLANRRYREVPNRIYADFDPRLKEQAEGKGSFEGELLIETQPTLTAGVTLPEKRKMTLTAVAQVAVVAAAILFYVGGLQLAEVLDLVIRQGVNTDEQVNSAITMGNNLIWLIFAWLTVRGAANVMNKASHMFWGEMTFSSLLMFMKTEGTYTESRVSTGMAIHDSTRSENVVVRSSITPWIITSRINTSIFATSGMNNLESPRFIMGMNKNDAELGEIVTEIKAFLRGRETIASITNEADLANAGTIHQVNQQTRSHNDEPQSKITLEQEEEAAGFLRNNADQEDENKS